MSLNTSMSQSTSFVIDFGEETKEKSISDHFTRQHWRNKSLPIVNTTVSKCQLLDSSFCDVKTEPIKMTNGSFNFRATEAIYKKTNSNLLKENQEYENSSDGDSSEGGTYTLDKDDTALQKAREEIEEVFGIKPETCSNDKETKKSWSKTILVNEWVEKNTVSSVNLLQNIKPVKLQQNVTRIPSPITVRRMIPSSNSALRKTTNQNIKGINQMKDRSNRNDDTTSETEGYLKETENIVSALQKRIDSGTNSNIAGDDEIKTTNRNNDNSTCNRDKLENDKLSVTRYNRAFSLRRERLNKTAGQEIKTSIPVRQRTLPPPESPVMSKLAYCASNGDLHRSTLSPRINREQQTSFSSTTKFTRPDTPVSPKFSVRKQIKELKKKVIGSTSSGSNNNNNNKTGRSNTTLSSQQIEFQNWKRRKSYDPMKAAAEGKRKSLEKKNSGGALLRSVSTTLSSDNSVLRSASFHATQGPSDALEGYTSAEENELNYSGKEWKVPKPPSTSLENSPPGSRISILSNASSSSLLYSNFESTDLTKVNEIAQLSVQIKEASCKLVEKLRRSFTEDYKKVILSNELDNISHYGSNSALPSYPLTFTHENLKEIHSIVRALDQVLLN